MNRRGAGGRKRGDDADHADLQRPEDHCRALIAIVDGFDPSPELRAWALRAIDVEAVHEWRDLPRGGPVERGRGRPQDALARDLARGCARVWMELSGEFPPISKAAARRGGVEVDGRFVNLVMHAFGLAGLPVGRRRANDIAEQVRRELPEQHPAPFPTEDECRPEPRLEELLDAAIRESAVPAEARVASAAPRGHRHRRPRRGPKLQRE